jgi:hypothetical protein
MSSLDTGQQRCPLRIDLLVSMLPVETIPDQNQTCPWYNDIVIYPFVPGRYILKPNFWNRAVVC